MCAVLKVGRSGFYAWSKRGPSSRSQRREELVSQIEEIREEPYMDCYGSPRLHQELLARGYDVCRSTVEKLMQQEGLRASTQKPFRPTTTDSNHSLPVAENTVNRQFKRTKPNEVWVSDLTYIPTRAGWLFLVVIIDLYSRRVVGWSMSQQMTTDVFLSALDMALAGRSDMSGLVHHSDRGSQYCSHAFQKALRRNRIDCSMSRKGNCYDNAVAESFFATLKKELVYQNDYADHASARRSVFHYIETFYNRVRRHSSLGWLSPEQFEQQT